ncbi:MAG: hypothetical protein NVS3B21_07010 [Acidimicrobiales bacterium]
MTERGIAIGVIAALACMGVAIALADFGTGHSSRSALLEVPTSWVKIDRRFTEFASAGYAARSPSA